MDKQTKILLVDDHPLFRKGLRLLLEEEQDFRVVGEAGNGREAVDLAQKYSPHIVVMDITMPDLNGIEACRHIVSRSPNTKVMALSIHSGKKFVEDMLRAGAAGYLLKESAAEELVKGIRTVVRGKVFLSPTITGVVVSQYMNVLLQADATAGQNELTAREREIVQLIAEGNSIKQIASALKVSIKTVESSLRRIMKKLDVKNAADLTEIARERQWFSAPGQAPAAETVSHPILKTKLHRPPLPPDLVTRTQILNQLTDLETRPITLVSAPAGYGKSTTASSWLETCDRPHAWLSLDEDDSDLRQFLSYFLSAIQTIFPSAGQATRAFLRAPNLAPLYVLTETLINDLDQIDENFILVLDDYHCIREMAVHDLLTALLNHPPKKMHLALLTRRDPPLPLNKLRALSQMKEIFSVHLRFSPAETAMFLENVLKRPVEKSTATVLDERIEGWPVGLRLVAHALENQEDLERIVAGLKGGFSSIMDYLVSEVLSRQTPPVADYLLKSALLDRFCAPLCDALRAPDSKPDQGGVTGAEFIAGANRNNLFLIALDAENRWFRYHHMFQQLLQNQLESLFNTKDIEDLHCRASKWFEENGFFEEAIKHALAGGEVAEAAQLVEKTRQELLNNDRWFVFEKWLSMFPDNIIQQRPGLLLTRAWLHYHHFNIPALSSILDAVESILGDTPIDEPLRGEIDFFRGYICYFQNKGSVSLKHFNAALKRVPEDHHEIRGQIEILHGLASQMQGRKEEAVKTLNKLLYHSRLPESIRRTRLLATVAYIHIIAGDLDEALAANQQLYDCAKKSDYRYARVWSIYLKGLIHFYRNDLEKAIDHFHQAIENRSILHTRATVDSLAGLAYAYQATGQSGYVGDTIQLLSEYVGSLSDPAYSIIAQACRARLSIMQGELEQVIGWIRGNPPPVENMIWWLEIPSVTHCRALLAEGSEASLKKASTKLQELSQLNQSNHNTLQGIEIMSLLALTLNQQGKLEKALALLGQAVQMAEPGLIIRPFVELGTSIAELLTLLKEQGKAVHVAVRILSALKKEEAGVPSGVPANGTIPLTKRELEILSLAAEGLSNKEIAKKVFLSTETVKKHLYNTYRKLDADSRINALAKARELGILPSS